MRGSAGKPLPRLANRSARRLFLQRHGLGRPPQEEDLAGLIERLGFVQIDSIATVERAYHMILAARRKSYRPQQLDDLLEGRRTLFEHWTHDASVVPMSFYPHWRLRFRRDVERLRALAKMARGRIRGALRRGAGAHPRGRARHGARVRRWPTARRSRLVGLASVEDGAGVPLAHRGACHRPARGVSEDLRPGRARDPPAPVRAVVPDDRETLDWARAGALDRLGFASAREIAAFWDTASLDEARSWCAARDAGELVEVAVEGARRGVARPPVRASRPVRAGRRGAGAARRGARAQPLRPAAARPQARRMAVRLPLSHRDLRAGEQARIRLLRLPAAGGRPAGRACRHAPPGGRLSARALWPERGVRLGKGRLEHIGRELDRIVRFCGCDGPVFEKGWVRESRE